MRVRWTPDARRDRGDIYDYIATDNRSAAARLDKVFAAAATSLRTFPNRGRRGAIPGTRELFPHENYRLVYEVASGTVTIIALVHAARNWPP